ncbi:MAG: phytanoyl-CoA dioxygenase family protein [Gammaproteobacteria bacterium]|nr:phytanoyl-CoA dioxygenase family protein [Gammaproteobacteria bacterium]
MNTVYFDSNMPCTARRQQLYAGQLFVFSPTESTRALCDFARSLIREAFAPLDPELAQHSLSVERYAGILGELKPKFIHHDESKRLIRAVLAELECDLGKEYFDVPKMRSSTSDGYLTTGIAYAWHPHRDTWYSAPTCQLNWWLPIFAIEQNNAMAFHPLCWDRPVANTSADYNYYRWNKMHRGKHVAKLIGQDPRPLPRASEPLEREPELRIVCEPGGLILFSSAQMHSSVPNTSGRTRFSMDFRTVNLDDLVARRGAPNFDSACTGTTLRDYMRATDLSRIPDEIVAAYDDGSAAEGDLVYRA